MKYPFSHIVEILNARIIQKPASEILIHRVLIDSRQISLPRRSVFIALIGERHDGHDYLEDVYEKGVSCFVVSRQVDPDKFPRAGILQVNNTLTALQQLAAFHRNQYDFTCIGITGSNGKTIIKEWLFQLLRVKKEIVRSPRSYNSQVGVPLSVLQTEERHDLAIFEAGISKPGEMEKLEPMIRPAIGIFSNIGEAHAEGFQNIEEKINEKLKLFTHVEHLIYCRDQELLDRQIQSAFEKNRLFTWSTQKPADLQITEIQKMKKGTRITGQMQGEQAQISIQIPFKDDASVENAIHCWAYLIFKKYPRVWISERMSLLEPVAMRLELKEGINNSLIINDSYNSDIKSLGIALDFLDQQQGHAGKSLILSDILQSKEDPDQLYKRVGTLLQERNLNRVIGIGEHIHALSGYLPSDVKSYFYPNTLSFLSEGWEKKFRDEIILIKGARKYRFEKISDALARQVHSARLEIDLNALVDNLNVYRRFLREETRMMVMVKAFAYGAGIEVAKTLQFNQVDYLAVANADEGLQLRRAGIHIPIMILNAEPGSLEVLLKENLEPEIYSPTQLRKLLARWPERKKQLPIHLKCDSGMHRLGFTREDLPELFGILRGNPQLTVQSVFSHLASSEDSSFDSFTKEQIRYFNAFCDALQEEIKASFLRHIVNSAGIHRFPQFQFDMVRLGLGLYGVDPSGEIQNQLQGVLRWTASVSQLKSLKPGETVGYGRKGKITRPSRIATVNVGYADGLPRLAGNGRFSMYINGHFAPTVGNICMDMSMIDVSGIDNLAEGDEVVIFGPEHPVTHLAESAMTIPYEIFSGIPPRIKRVYYQE